MEQFEGFYARFETPSKKEGSLMMGADDLVGTPYSVEMKAEEGRMVAWISNPFGAERGFLGAKDSERVQLALARGWEVKALLAFLAYDEAPEPGLYWGQVAVFCFSPTIADAAEGFIKRVGAKLADGVRVKIDLTNKSVQKMVSDPTWLPAERTPLPKKQKGTAIIKDHQSMSDKMVEQGRARNKGCYVVSWAFIIIVVALVVFGGAKLLGVI